MTNNFFPTIFIPSKTIEEAKDFHLSYYDIRAMSYSNVRAESLANRYIFTEDELKERDEKIRQGAFADTEADGYVFCGKCGKQK